MAGVKLLSDADVFKHAMVTLTQTFITTDGYVKATIMPALTGDVTSPLGSVNTTLATANDAVGTFGSPTTVPVITVDGKGRVTHVSTVPALPPVTDAPSADKLSTAHNITMTGDISWSVSFDGSGDTTATATLALVNALTPGVFGNVGALSVPILTVDTKGRITHADTYLLGTSAGVDLGTSGNHVPLLSGVNSWSGIQTFTKPVITTPSTAAGAGLNVPAGVAPTTPNAGDVYVTNGSRIKYFDGTTEHEIAFTTSAIAGTVSQLTTPRVIRSSGDVTWQTTFDGSQDVTGTATLANVNSTTGTFGSAGQVPSFTVDSKGRITAASFYTIGSSALYNVGTSGNVIPLLSGANTWSAPQTFSNGISLSGLFTAGAGITSNATTSVFVPDVGSFTGYITSFDRHLLVGQTSAQGLALAYSTTNNMAHVMSVKPGTGFTGMSHWGSSYTWNVGSTSMSVGMTLSSSGALNVPNVVVIGSGLTVSAGGANITGPVLATGVLTTNSGLVVNGGGVNVTGISQFYSQVNINTGNGAFPLLFVNSGAGADTRNWRQYTNGTGTTGSFIIDVANDAFTVANPAITISRSGATVAGILFGGPTVVSGNLTATGILLPNNHYLYSATASSVGLRIGSTPSYLTFTDVSGIPMIDGAPGTLYLGTAGTARGAWSSSGLTVGATNAATGRLTVLTTDETGGTASIGAFDSRHMLVGTSTGRGIALAYSATNNMGHLLSVYPNNTWSDQRYWAQNHTWMTNAALAMTLDTNKNLTVGGGLTTGTSITVNGVGYFNSTFQVSGYASLYGGGLVNNGLTINNGLAVNSGLTTLLGGVRIGTATGTAAGVGLGNLQVLGEVVSRGATGGFVFEDRSQTVTGTTGWSEWYRAAGYSCLWNGNSNIISIDPTGNMTLPYGGLTVAGSIIMGNNPINLSGGYQIGNGVATGFYTSGSDLAIRTNSANSLYLQSTSGAANWAVINGSGFNINTPLYVSNSTTILGRGQNNQVSFNYYGNDNNASMELGVPGTGISTNPYIDFHSSGNNIDYDFRIMAGGGNTNNGQGGLDFYGTAVGFNCGVFMRNRYNGQFHLRLEDSGGYAFIQLGTSATPYQNTHFGSNGNGAIEFYKGSWGSGSFLARFDNDGGLQLCGSTIRFSNNPAYQISNDGTWTRFYQLPLNMSSGYYFNGNGGQAIIHDGTTVYFPGASWMHLPGTMNMDYNIWHQSTEGIQRFYWGYNSTSYYNSGSGGQHIFRIGQVDRLRVNNDGSLSMCGPTLYFNDNGGWYISNNGAQFYLSQQLNVNGSVTVNRNPLYICGQGDGNHMLVSGSGRLSFYGSDDGEYINSWAFFAIRCAQTGHIPLMIDGRNGQGRDGYMGVYDNGDPRRCLDVNGTVLSSSMNSGNGNIEMVGGNFKSMLRNDGGRTYFLFSDSTNDPRSAGFGGYRPWSVDYAGTLRINEEGGSDTYFYRNVYVSGFLQASSDRSLKKDFEAITNAREIFRNLEGWRYTLIRGEQRTAGLIAQDVYPWAPELIGIDENKKLTFAYDGFMAYTTQGLHDHEHELLRQEKKITELEAANDNLVNRLEAMEARLQRAGL